MSFRNDRHKSEICEVILAMKGMADPYWVTSDIVSGPTESAMAQLILLQEGGCSLSNGEGILLRAVLDLWNGSGGVSMWDMMTGLDPGVVQSIGELLMSIPDADPGEIDRWKEKWAGYDPAKEFFAD